MAKYYSYVLAIQLLIVVAKCDPTIDMDDKRIVGGTNAQLGTANFLASLRTAAGDHFCAGSIITPRWILTAAHCIAEIVPAYVTVGSVSLLSGTRYNVSKTIIHFLYDAPAFHNDIAMVKTERDIVYGQYVQPINLPWFSVGTGVSMIAMGWGLTSYPGVVSNDLKRLTTLSTSNQQCQQEWPSVVIESSQLCVYSSATSGLCRGDSGGPVVTNNEVHGVVSFTKPCALGAPDVLTRVSSHRVWINFVLFFYIF